MSLVRRFLFLVLTSFHFWVTLRVVGIFTFAIFLSWLFATYIMAETAFVFLFYYIYQALKAKHDLFIMASLKQEELLIALRETFAPNESK
jgi:hypothetical protein